MKSTEKTPIGYKLVIRRRVELLGSRPTIFLPTVLQTAVRKSDQKLDPYLGIEPSINGFADRAVTQPGHTGRCLQPGSNRHLTHKEQNWCDLSVLVHARNLAAYVGLEPTTYGLTVRRSTD